MEILIVEDDIDECNKYKKIIKESKRNIKLVGVTNSSKEAIKLLKKCKPDAVILDLELNAGEGNGFDVIENIKNMELAKMPRIIITTNIYSDFVYNFLHKNKVDFIFYKNQLNYSQENVLEMLTLLGEYQDRAKTEQIKENYEELQSDKLDELINNELDLIGVGSHLKGRKYLFDSIRFAIENNENEKNGTIIQFLVAKYKRSNSTISRAMQNAILHAWRISSIEDLTELYTARINYETGIPTPTEFIYYYKDKIGKML